jgi:hypothetical protein
MYLVSIILLNYGGLIVTAELTAVHRTIFEALRTLFIWLASLFIHYVIDPSYGEDWNPWIYLELAGFVVLVFSLMLHNETVKIKCLFTYPEEADKISQSHREDFPLTTEMSEEASPE